MKLTWLIIVLQFVYNPVSSQIISLDKKAEVEVSGNFSLFADSTKSLNANDIVNAFADNKFKQPDTDSFDTNRNVYWLHFNLFNSLPVDQEWILDFQNWSLVTAYIKEDNNLVAHHSGHLYPYKKRDYSVANKSYILTQIKSGEKKEYFVRLESKYNNELVPENLNFTIAERSIVDKQNAETGKFIYSVLAIFFITFLYNFLVFISTRLKSYALYLIVIFFAFYHTAYNSGYIVELFGGIDRFPVWLTSFETLSSSLFGVSILLFANEFLRVKERYPAWNKIIRIILWSYLIFGILLLFNQEIGTITTSLSGFATILVIIVVSIKSLIDRYPSAAYFLVGYSAFLLGILVIILSYVNVLPRTDWTFSYALPIGSTIQIILFSVALGNMINVLKRENEENQKKHQIYLQEKQDMKHEFQQEILKAQLEIQEQTYHNISDEIHDNIGQALTLIKVNINAIEGKMDDSAKEKLADSGKIITNVIQSLRDLSKSLNTDFINDMGLSGAIERQLTLLKKTGLYTTQFSSNGEVSSYEPQRELVTFRTVQELLNNIVKHAEATTLGVSMNYQTQKLIITVWDDGKGFDIKKVNLSDTGLGLRNIYNRIRMINGTVSIESQADKGSVITLEILK